MKLNHEELFNSCIKILKNTSTLDKVQMRMFNILMIDYGKYVKAAGYDVNKNIDGSFSKGFKVSNRDELVDILLLIMHYRK